MKDRNSIKRQYRKIETFRQWLKRQTIERINYLYSHGIANAADLAHCGIKKGMKK